MSEVKITDGLIYIKRNIVKETTITYIRKALNNELDGVEPSGAFENFRIAAGESDRNFYGLVSQDSDVFKWMEAVSLSLQYENKEILRFPNKYLTFNARIAFNTAIIITPTSAKIANHIFAIPMAPKIKQTSLIPIAI